MSMSISELALRLWVAKVLTTLATAFLVLAGAPASAASPADRFAAAAWYEGAMNIWYSTGYSTREEAEAAANSACEAVAGGACINTSWSHGGAIAGGYSDMGGPFVVSGDTPSLARQNLVTGCAAQGRRCAVERTVSANSPKGVTTTHGSTLMRNGWGTFAYKSGDYPQRVSRVWVVAGHPTHKSAVAAAIKLCEQHEGAECTAKGGVANGHMLIFTLTDERSTPLIEGDRSVEAAYAAMDLYCPGAGIGHERCTVHASIDVRQPQTREVEINVERGQPNCCRATPAKPRGE